METSTTSKTVAEKVTRGAVARIIGTIIIVTAFLVGSLIWIGFYAVNYTLFQKIIVFFVALILAIAAVSIMWIAWGVRQGWKPSRSRTWN